MDLVLQAVTELKRGNIILYPTHTVYGLGVDALNPDAVEALQALKGRAEDKAFLVILPDIESISKYAVLNYLRSRLRKSFFEAR